MIEAGTKDAVRRIGSQIDIPAGVATWVFLAHVVALFSPLVIAWQVHRYADELGALLDAPFMLHVAAAFFFTGSAFEIAQNTQDRWYYTGPYPALADLLFNTFIAFGLGALGLAAGIDAWWVVVIVGAAAVAFPTLYLREKTPYPATGVLGIVAVGLLYDALREPAILLLLVFTTGLNLYFLVLVVRTHAQAMHGAIALTNGVGLLAVPWAIEGAVAGGGASWGLTIGIALALALGAAAAWPRLARLRATPHRLARETEGAR